MLELLQFRFSPYNEKLRWALDLKRVPHRRTPLLPGPHLPRVKRCTGRTTTPVLLGVDGVDGVDAAALDNSADLLAWLEQRYPQPPLMPADPALREAALAVQRRFDDDIGPRGRRTVLATLLETPRYFAQVFGAGHGPWAQRGYAITVPLAATLVRKGNGITGPASIADGHAAFEEGLAFVASQAAATGYLVGSCFSVADLTAASMLAMAVDPPASPMARPKPMPAPFAALVQRHARHPGAQWVRDIYARHRAAATDFNGASPY